MINDDLFSLDITNLLWHAKFVEIDYKGSIYQCFIGTEGISFIDEGLPSYEEGKMCMECQEFIMHCHCSNKKNVSAKERKAFEQKSRTVFIKEIMDPYTEILVPLDSAMAKAIVRRLATVRRAIFRKQREENKYAYKPKRSTYYKNMECNGCHKLVDYKKIEKFPWVCPRCGEINKRNPVPI